MIMANNKGNTRTENFRNMMREAYDERRLEDAAKYGESLLEEHEYNRFKSPNCDNDVYNLAVIYDELGRLERAANLYYESVRYVRNNDFRGAAVKMSNLAGALARMGALKNAYHFYMQARRMILRYADINSADFADNLYSTANLVAELQDYDEAIDLHTQALEARMRLDNQEDIVHSLHSLAFVYQDMGDNKKAISCAETALDFAVDNGYIGTHYYLAELYFEDGQHQKALPLYEKALSVYRGLSEKDFHTLDDVFFANCLRNMALLYDNLGETASAEDCMLQSVKSRKLRGDSIINEACFLIRLYLKKGAYSKAVDMLVYTLIQDGNISTTSTVNALLNVFAQAGNPKRLLTAIKKINDPDKIQQILNKWRKKKFL